MTKHILTYAALVLVMSGIFMGILYRDALSGYFGKPERFTQGDCIKMNWEGIESWYEGTIVRVEVIGKNNYGVKYWYDYGWSQGTGTWPFSLPAVKVECPKETREVPE